MKLSVMLALALTATATWGVAQKPHDPSPGSRGITRTAAGTIAFDATSYTGHDADGIPHYVLRPFTADERALLREAYGVEDASRLYVSDSSAEGVLKYDTERKRCRTCYVNSYRIGFISLRRPDESWDALERRVAAMRPRDFSPAARVESKSIADLDPAIRRDVEQMLADASRAGFTLRAVATYRSLEREAYLMARGGGTHTLTSLHAYGRAIDLVVGDGNVQHARTRTAWIAFRRWVTAYRGHTSPRIHERRRNSALGPSS